MDACVDADTMKCRLVELAGRFERELAVPPKDATPSDLSEWAARGLMLVKRASDNVARVAELLLRDQRREQGLVDNARTLLYRLANFVDLPEKVPDEADEATLSRAYAFDMMRQTKQEMEIDFPFMVSSLLSSDAQADWCAANPFLEKAVQAELMKLVSTMLLHTSTILHISARQATADRLWTAFHPTIS